ncbi:MAG: DUF72 domain-containing protein [Candidatus Ranarchaeia archaeon]|jgi:uncharacterized protein YecE (DUF72 family)
MAEYRIGGGGWAYFKIPGTPPLEAYSQVFDFVEVNTTFYQIPKIDLVASWRKRVPEDFEFSVKCHQAITHTYQFSPNRQVLDTFQRMVEICHLLKTRFLVFETPASIALTPAKLTEIRDFFATIDYGDLDLVWEIRRHPNQSIPSPLQKILEDHGILQSVDLSKEDPVGSSKKIYSRLFGSGDHNIYQFTDEELQKIDERVNRKNPEVVAISFHTQRMYKDATRYKIFKKTQQFVPVTKARGVMSLKEVLLEDAQFPTTRINLIKDQGWKVIDLTDSRRVRASYYLDQLTKDSYVNIEAVLQDLPK